MGKATNGQRKGKGSVFTSKLREHTYKLRRLDFRERKTSIRGVIRYFKHDPRSVPIAAIEFPKTTRYGKTTEFIPAAEGMYTGQYVIAGPQAPLQVGNVIPLHKVPEGSIVCNVEKQPGDRGVISKMSGTYCLVVGQNANKSRTRLKLPSGQKKSVHHNCRAMIGLIAGGGRIEKPLLKGGRAHHKYLKRRNNWPRIRGVAKNPVDHPHGGGNHQHIGHPATVSRHAPPGQKVGLVAARRTGRIRGVKATEAVSKQ